MSKAARRTLILLLLILLLALALRLWLWSRPAHPLANDENEYFAVGMDLAHGRGLVFYDTYRWLRAPLYPLFLALFFWLGGDHARVATLAQVLLSTATVYGFYLLSRRLFRGPWSERAGLIAALLAALLLPLATFPALFMSETLFTFLLVAFLLALLGVPEAAPRRRWRWAAAAGVLLGLCALTRAVALAFTPLAAGWLFVVLWREEAKRQGGASASQREGGPAQGTVQAQGRALRGRIGRACVLPLLVALAGLATIAPWTIHNAIVYRRFIPLDTGAAYSLWAFYEPHEEIAEINRQLEAIPNPGDRQAYAVQKWLDRLREDPGIAVRRLPATFPYLLRIKPIEDRFLKLPYREPGLGYFLLALLADDGLYVLITVTALAAFFFLPADRGKALALLWLLYNIAVMMVLHAEARYRQLLLPAMIPYAALVLARGRHVLAGTRRELAWRGAALALLLAGWCYCFVAYSPWEWVSVNVQRGFHQAVGRAAWALGRPEDALASYTRAMEADDRNPEPYYDLAWAYEHMGRLDEAARAYHWCWGTRATYLPCSTALGNILRQQGQLEAAREAFHGRYVADADVVAWAWDHLSLQPVDRLDVGDGLDYGYVEGVHAPEAAAGSLCRWTAGQARFRLWAGQAGQVRLRLRLAAPRLGPAAPAAVSVLVNGRVLAHWEVVATWDTYETPPFAAPDQQLEIVVQSTSFVPQEVSPDLPDTRELGVQVDWVEVRR